MELIEPDKYASRSFPASFPWLTPASSSPHILKELPVCAPRSLSTLPLRLSAFRALRGGTVTITAPLAPAWRALTPSRRRGLHAYHAVVRIR